jgi:acetolactate synthase-1/2/3 large subunit
MCLTGQVPSEFLGRERGHLHELADLQATLSTFIKAAYRIEHLQDTNRTFSKAWRTMISGRQGPVSLVSVIIIFENRTARSSGGSGSPVGLI